MAHAAKPARQPRTPKPAPQPAPEAAPNPAPRSAPQPAAESAPEAAPKATLSAAQLAANRANAQHSTGPRTPEGKAVSSRNALRHGLFSRSLHQSARLLGEDPAEFDALLGDLLQRYAPQGREEELMVDCMATLWWRRMRLITHGQAELSDRLANGHVPLYALRETEFIGTYDARFERSLQRMHKDLAFLQRYRDDAREDAQADAERRAGEELAAFEARFHAETEEIIRRGLALSRRRRAEEEAELPDDDAVAADAPAAGDEQEPHPEELSDEPGDELPDGELPDDELCEDEPLAAAAPAAAEGDAEALPAEDEPSPAAGRPSGASAT